MFKKILQLSLVLLLIVTVVELGYFLKLTYFEKTKVPVIQDTPNVYVSPTIGFPPGTTPAIHPEVVDVLKRGVYDANIQMSIKADTHSSIVEIAANGKKLRDMNFPFALKLTSSTIGSRWFFFSDELLKQIKVYSRAKGKDTLISIKDLSVGDKIFMSEIYDPFFAPGNPDQLINFEIYKLE